MNAPTVANFESNTDMNTHRLLAKVAFLISVAGVVAAPSPIKTNTGDPAPKPVTFSASPIHFPVDGKEHHPNITVMPAGATYKVNGQSSAKDPGVYTLTVTATGNYFGTMTCKWRIDAPAKKPKRPMTPEKAAQTAEMIKKLRETPSK